MKVLYISTNFTALSHTFITREVNQLRKMGAEVHLLSLRSPGTSATTEPECDLSGCHFAYPAPWGHTLWAAGRTLIRTPGRLKDALGTIAQTRDATPAVKLKLLYQLATANRFAQMIQKKGIEHIHAHFAGSPTTFALLLHRLTGIPFTFTDHGAGIFHERVALDVKFRHAAGISAISQYNIAYYRKITSDLPPVRVVRCGLALEQFSFRQRIRSGDPVRILAISRLVPKKGFAYLLDSLHLLSQEGIAWLARIVGEGPLLESLQAQANTLGLDDLEFTGPRQQSEIRRYLEEADVFVLPCVVAPDGDMDGIPVTIMEAMACGCPVISTRVSGIPELVRDGETGLLLDPEDAPAIAAAVSRLIRDPGLVTRLSRAGREWIEQEFNIVASAERQLAFFHELAQTRT